MKVGHNLYKCEIECIVYTTKYPKPLLTSQKSFFKSFEFLSPSTYANKLVGTRIYQSKNADLRIDG